ncbi:MAG: lysophospholipase [Lachnospiraceae bacterium]|nr:lysophospholipase [Lachnospiraceae bacterium]
MGKKNAEVIGAEGYKINLLIFETDEQEVKGSILLLHGMAEHHGRYLDFIKALNKAGFDAYIYDHRGHGQELPASELGFFALKNGDKLVIEDAVCAMKYVAEHKRSEKFALFGHSMGSLIARNVIQLYDKMDCVLLCGTGFQGDAMCKAGMALANVVSCFCGPKHKSPFLNKMMFETKVYLRDCKRTKSDWLSKDEKVVDAYRADPACGFVCCAKCYHDLVSITGNAKWGMDRTRHDLPIFIASGSDDPVGDFGAGIKACFEKYKELGFSDVTMKLYENDRHELLNETDKDVVYKDFIDFFTKKMA